MEPIEKTAKGIRFGCGFIHEDRGLYMAISSPWPSDTLNGWC